MVVGGSDGERGGSGAPLHRQGRLLPFLSRRCLWLHAHEDPLAPGHDPEGGCEGSGHDELKLEESHVAGGRHGARRVHRKLLVLPCAGSNGPSCKRKVERGGLRVEGEGGGGG